MRDSIKAVVLCLLALIAGCVCVSLTMDEPEPIKLKPMPPVETLPLAPVVDWSKVAQLGPAAQLCGRPLPPCGGVYQLSQADARP